MKLLKHLPGDLRCRDIGGICVLCDQPAGQGRICRQCRRILPWNDIFCDCCGQAINAVQPPGVACTTCESRQPRFEIARAPLIYDFPVDAVIKAIKFKRQLWYVPAFAELLLRTLESEFAGIDALVPVPLHRWRQIARGFNQATELCRPLQQATGLPILTQADPHPGDQRPTRVECDRAQEKFKRCVCRLREIEMPAAIDCRRCNYHR